MNEPISPEERRAVPEGAETPIERVQDVAAELRRRAEDLGYVAQERVRELGGKAGERTREAADSIRYFSEEARTEAAARLEGAGHYVQMQAGEIQENARETVRQHPGAALGLSVALGFLLALFSRRLVASMWRR